MKQHAGKILIVAVFLVGIGTAGVSIWFRYSETRRVLDYYGGQAAGLITSRESRATLLRLEPLKADERAEEDADTITIGDASYRVAAEREVTERPGFHNARNALTLDRSYDWSERKPPESLVWRYLLVIEEEGRRLRLLFSQDCEYIMHAEADKAVRAAAMADGLERLFDEQFE